MDIALAAEAHLVLGRMDIDIDLGERHFQEQHHRRILAFHQQSIVAMQHRMGDHFVTHVAAVDEGEQITRVGK